MPMTIGYLVVSGAEAATLLQRKTGIRARDLPPWITL